MPKPVDALANPRPVKRAAPKAGPTVWGKETAAAVRNFPISGQPLPWRVVAALLHIKAAAASANAGLQQLEPSIADAIVQAADSVLERQSAEWFPVDVFQTGSGTSSNMNVNEVLATLASERYGKPVHANDHVNCGQSSNDVFPSAVHIAAESALQETLLPALKQLHQSIQRRSKSALKIVKTGRTHLMDAVPLSLGQELSAWAAQLGNALLRIADSQKPLPRLTLGGTANGTGLNAHPKFAAAAIKLLCQRTGLALRANPNRFEALATVEAAVEMSGQLKVLATGLMKISNDLRWMNSGPVCGLAEVQLPALQAGSSIMPGKVNPVIPEACCMVAAQVIGNDAAITIAAQSGNFQLNVMWPLVARNLLESIELLANACRLLATQCIDGLVVNEERLAQQLWQNPVIVTALNRHIGYEQGALIARRALAERRSVLAVAVEVTGIAEAELARLMDPARLIRGGLA